jgi:hypothetical protein
LFIFELFVLSANVEDFATIPVLGILVAAVPQAEGLVRGFLPSLGLAVVNLIALGLLNVIVRIVRFHDYGSLHTSILGRFFLFFVFNNLIGITVGGSIITVFQYLSFGDVAAVNRYLVVHYLLICFI